MKARLSIELHAAGVRRGTRWALSEITWRLQGGERWLLTGANGAGKTQLLKMLAGVVWPTPTGRERIEYRLGGRLLSVAEAQQRVAYLGAERQDRYARYGWDLTVCDLLATGLHGTDILLAPVTPAQQRRIAAMLKRCALGALASRHFLALSYGQQRLALLARALIREPDWLLLDELYNGLDAAFRRRVDAILAASRRGGQAWVIAAHRSADVPAGTQRMLHLRKGRIDYEGPLRRAALEVPDTAAPRRAGSPRIEAPRRAPVSRAAGKTLVRIVGADLYVNYRKVLGGVDWQLRRGEHWAVIGANGAGKSSFLKLIYGDLAPARGGSIERDGMRRGDHIEKWKRRVGFISPQLQSDYAIETSVEELVASGRHASIGLNEPMTVADRRSARRWLKRFGLADFAAAKPRELSYGELRRALFARAMAARAAVLLFDEPLTGLDPEQRASMRELMRAAMQRGIAVVVAVHHREDLPAGITHCLHLHNRKMCVEVSGNAT